MGTDDLSPLFRRRPSPGARFGQGKLLAWDPDTFENVVKWQGIELRDLPVLAGVEALTFVEGNEVVLVGWDQSGRRGTQDWAIWSRAIDPGTGAAEQAIAWMQTTLAREIAAEVFASQITSATAAGAVATSSASFVDLSGGPEVGDVQIGDTGRCLVSLACQMEGNTQNVPANTLGHHGGRYSFRISGATTRAGSVEGSVAFQNSWVDAGNASSRIDRYRTGAAVLVDNLNPGVHTFTAQYASIDIPGADPKVISFDARNLTVIAF